MSGVRVPRIRTIKPEFFTDAKIADLSPLDRLAFVGLWTVSDRSGHAHDCPRQLKVQIQPYDQGDFNETLDRLAEKGFILRYEVDGKKYLKINNFRKHQCPHHTERASTIPGPNGEAPEVDGHITVKQRYPHGDAPGRKGRERNNIQHLGQSRPPGGGHGFDNFWAIYPRKVKKDRAFRLWKAMSIEEKDLAISAVKAYAEAWANAPPDRRQFIPYGSSWLSAKRWQDDPAEWVREASPKPGVPAPAKTRDHRELFPEIAAFAGKAEEEP